MGSFYGWMYNGGGNNAEALVTGKIAGTNVAAEKPWVWNGTERLSLDLLTFRRAL